MNRHIHLETDCKKCFGLCCVALHFYKRDGFPLDKEAKDPCIHLQHDFRCKEYLQLMELGYSGCMTFDCFGAGQQVSAITFEGRNWHDASDHGALMFSVFQVMRQLHELLWYLSTAREHSAVGSMDKAIIESLNETLTLTYGSPQEVLNINMDEQRKKVNSVLIEVSKLVRREARGEKPTGKKRIILPERGADFAGKDLRKVDLKGANLRGACLIAANLQGADMTGTDVIGADMRDANIKGADLAGSLFLTQAQINAAFGDDTTKLPNNLVKPRRWSTS